MRILREFERRGLPLTVFGVATALQRPPRGDGQAFTELGHEIARHGLKWIHYQGVSREVERAHMAEAMQIIQGLTAAARLGWYTGRDSPRTTAWWPTMTGASATTATTTATTRRSG